jgi:hypothetical protein
VLCPFDGGKHFWKKIVPAPQPSRCAGVYGHDRSLTARAPVCKQYGRIFLTLVHQAEMSDPIPRSAAVFRFGSEISRSNA